MACNYRHLSVISHQSKLIMMGSQAVLLIFVFNEEKLLLIAKQCLKMEKGT